MLGICLNIPKTAYVENRQFSEKLSIIIKK